MADRADITIYQGDDYSASVEVNHADGSNADLTGYTLMAQIRRDVADRSPTVAADITVAFLDAAAGLISLKVSHTVTTALTSNYVWDLQLTAPSGIITTVLAGAVSVRAEVTR
jgi:hypothetical protein